MNRKRMFHLYLKCFVLFYGMVNYLGEENNVLHFYWAHTGWYVPCITPAYWNEALFFACQWNFRADSPRYSLYVLANKPCMGAIFTLVIRYKREIYHLQVGDISHTSGRYITYNTSGSLNRELNPRPPACGNTASIKGTTTLTTQPNPFYKIERSITRVVREIPWWTTPKLKYFRSYSSTWATFRTFFHMRVWSNTSCLYNEISEEKHKLVHTINRSLNRESNLRSLAYGRPLSG
jgi:hypothetical protein